MLQPWRQWAYHQFPPDVVDDATLVPALWLFSVFWLYVFFGSRSRRRRRLVDGGILFSSLLHSHAFCSGDFRFSSCAAVHSIDVTRLQRYSKRSQLDIAALLLQRYTIYNFGIMLHLCASWLREKMYLRRCFLIPRFYADENEEMKKRGKIIERIAAAAACAWCTTTQFIEIRHRSWVRESRVRSAVSRRHALRAMCLWLSCYYRRVRQLYIYIHSSSAEEYCALRQRYQQAQHWKAIIFPSVFIAVVSHRDDKFEKLALLLRHLSLNRISNVNRNVWPSNDDYYADICIHSFLLSSRLNLLNLH